MPSRYDEENTVRMPSSTPPPTGCRSPESTICFSLSSDFGAEDISWCAANMASPSRAAETRSKFVGVIRLARNAVVDDPTTAPTVPPIATKPKRRAAWVGRNRSAINDQKIDTTKRLKTLVQTKKTRPAQMPDPSEMVWKTYQKMMRLTAKKV